MTVACRNRATGTNTAVVGRGGEFGDQAIYDVTDPVHPRLLCQVMGTTAHLSSALRFQYLEPRSATETDIVERSLVDGTETLVGKLAGSITSAAWLATGPLGAYTMKINSSSDCPFSAAVQVWTYAQGTSELLTTYCIGIGDCICRFGLPGPVLAFSFDGRYLVEGLLAGKGSTPMGVYRIADRVKVATLTINTDTAFWDRSSDRLFEINHESVQAWTPDGTTVNVPGATTWNYYPNLSPDDAYATYTAFADQVDGTLPRVYLYGLGAAKTRLLIDQPRSQVVFVKDAWVWYLEEAACADCPGQTQPTGRVFAMNVSTGVEQQVVFATGEGLTYATDLLPGEFWPNS